LVWATFEYYRPLLNGKYSNEILRFPAYHCYSNRIQHLYKIIIERGYSKRLNLKSIETHIITLTLFKRLGRDISQKKRHPDALEISLAGIKLYGKMNTSKSDVSNSPLSKLRKITV